MAKPKNQKCLLCRKRFVLLLSHFFKRRCHFFYLLYERSFSWVVVLKKKKRFSWYLSLSLPPAPPYHPPAPFPPPYLPSSLTHLWAAGLMPSFFLFLFFILSSSVTGLSPLSSLCLYLNPLSLSLSLSSTLLPSFLSFPPFPFFTPPLPSSATI